MNPDLLSNLQKIDVGVKQQPVKDWKEKYGKKPGCFYIRETKVGPKLVMITEDGKTKVGWPQRRPSGNIDFGIREAPIHVRYAVVEYLKDPKAFMKKVSECDVPGTMNPQEKPDLNAEDVNMEDYSDEDDPQKLKSKSKETDNSMKEVPDKDLEQKPEETKESKTDETHHVRQYDMSKYEGWSDKPKREDNFIDTMWTAMGYPTAEQRIKMVNSAVDEFSNVTLTSRGKEYGHPPDLRDKLIQIAKKDKHADRRRGMWSIFGYKDISGGQTKESKVNEVTAKDPTREEMFEVLSKSPYANEGGFADDAEIAMYWFANNYHGGQSSNLYSVLSTSEYRPGPLTSGVEKEGDLAMELYDVLVHEFSGEEIHAYESKVNEEHKQTKYECSCGSQHAYYAEDEETGKTGYWCTRCNKWRGTDAELRSPGKSSERRIRETLRLCNSCFKTFRSNETKCQCGSDNTEIIGEREYSGMNTGMKKVWLVKYSLDGKSADTRVMAYDEADAKKQIETTHKGAKVESAKLVSSESKVNEEGLAAKAGKKPEDFDKDQLAAGIKVEKEHTDDESKAQKIAMDHLTEDPDYYKKLKKMEAGACGESKVNESPIGGKKISIFEYDPDDTSGLFESIRDAVKESCGGYVYEDPTHAYYNETGATIFIVSNGELTDDEVRGVVEKELAVWNEDDDTSESKVNELHEDETWDGWADVLRTLLSQSLVELRKCHSKNDAMMAEATRAIDDFDDFVSEMEGELGKHDDTSESKVNEQQGWREGWQDRVIANCPGHKIMKKGYLTALYTIRNESLPGAYDRAPATREFQDGIAYAISTLDPRETKTADRVEPEKDEKEGKAKSEARAPDDADPEDKKIQKLTETILELVDEMDKITTEDRKKIRSAVESGVLENEFPSDEQMIDELSQQEDFLDPSTLDSDVDVKMAWLKYVAIVKAIDAETKESKISEQFADRMMPGQKPETPEEKKKREAMVSAAAKAVEGFGDDELEAYSAAIKKRQQGIKR